MKLMPSFADHILKASAAVTVFMMLPSDAQADWIVTLLGS